MPCYFYKKGSKQSPIAGGSTP